MKKIFQSDVDILASLGEGNPYASKYVYETYYPIISKWIITNSGSLDQAQDIFQDGLIVLYQKSKDPEFCLTCAIGTYLFAICKRLWYKRFQQNSKKQEWQVDFSDEERNWDSVLAHEESDVSAYLEQEQNHMRLEASLEKLGEPCLQLIRLFYIDKKSMQDIATQLQYANTETAKVQKYKCITRLKKIFFSSK